MLRKFLTVLPFLWAGATLADAPRVVADIAPVHGLVARVMEGAGAPDLVVPHGRSPHGHRLRPSEASALESAAAVFWVSSDLTPWMARSLSSLSTDAVSIELMTVAGTHVLPFRESAAFQGHGHDHGHDHGGDTDPHGWLDPENAKTWLQVIAGNLAEIDPENASLYTRNAEQAQQEIAAVEADVLPLLTAAKSHNIMVYHDAFQYLEVRFGLPVVGAISLGDASGPGAGRLADIQALAASADVACVFSEPQFNAKLIAAALGQTDAKTAVIDPLGSEIPLGPQFYPQLLRSIAKAIGGCVTTP